MERVVILNLFAYACANVEVFWKGMISFLTSTYDIILGDFIFFTSFSEFHFGQTIEYAGLSPWQLAQCSLLAHDLSSWPSSPQRAHMILCWHLVYDVQTFETGYTSAGWEYTSQLEYRGIVPLHFLKNS